MDTSLQSPLIKFYNIAQLWNYIKLTDLRWRVLWGFHSTCNSSKLVSILPSAQITLASELKNWDQKMSILKMEDIGQWFDKFHKAWFKLRVFKEAFKQTWWKYTVLALSGQINILAKELPFINVFIGIIWNLVFSFCLHVSVPPDISILLTGHVEGMVKILNCSWVLIYNWTLKLQRTRKKTWIWRK